MGKLKKILTTFIILVGIFTFSIIKVDAATGTVSISKSTSKVVVGNTVTVNIKVSSPKALGVFQYNVSYNSSYLSLISGDETDIYYFDGSDKSKTITLKFKAKKSGNPTIKVSFSGAYTSDEEALTLNSTSTSVKIITQAELEASYSSNNKLSKLGIEGYSLSPSFSSNVTSYTVNLPANTESIKVTGTKDDSSASVEGLGTKTVVDGTNTIKVVVTAENGSTKTYTITAIVEELDPINVTIDNNIYTVIRKAKLLESPSTDFIESTTTINDNEVPTLYNEKANLTLVGLKDNEGNIKLYIYDKENNTYTIYNQYTFSSLVLYIEDKEIDNHYKIEEITINDKKINAYTFEKDNYYYFYAINLETGKENIYRYDNDEQTIQKYIEPEKEEIKEVETNDELYRYIILGLLAFIFLTYFTLLLSLLIKGRKKKVKKQEVHVEQITPEALNKNEEINTEEQENEEVTEKEKYIKESEKELNRINNENTNDENEINDVVSEVFDSEETINKKNKKSKKKKKE